MFCTLNTQLNAPHVTYQCCVFVRNTYNSNTRTQESHAEVNGGASDSVSAYLLNTRLLRAQRILHLLITRGV